MRHSVSSPEFVKSTPLRVVFFNSLLVVLSGDETLRLVLEILRQTQIFQRLCV